jgi:hypothetical protein
MTSFVSTARFSIRHFQTTTETLCYRMHVLAQQIVLGSWLGLLGKIGRDCETYLRALRFELLSNLCQVFFSSPLRIWAYRLVVTVDTEMKNGWMARG